jgi:hypothetical protein
VARIEAEVQLAVSRAKLDSVTSMRWADRIVERIPGAE